MTSPVEKPPLTHHDRLSAGLEHLQEAHHTGRVAAGAAKGLAFSLIETIGVLLGDPSLPDQVRDAYEGLLEAAREFDHHLGEP